ncbi:MAG: hypothetical protein PETM_01779 [Petrimonas sp.]|uniref:ATP-binding protein n=1 Tax=Petrimonas sp. TaxID=2023866 RepID=UPI0030CF40AA
MDLLIEIHRQRLKWTDTTFVRSLVNRIDWNSRLIGIKGSRGVGKTTLMLQYIKQNYGNSTDVLYVSLDNIWFTNHKMSDLVDDFVKRGGKYLFLDEVHKYPSWAQEIKNVYDNYPQLSIVFTGSSLLEILNARADLSRRADIYHLPGLSFREYMEMFHGIRLPTYSFPDILERHSDISDEVLSLFRPLQYFDDYLREGYYPFYVENPKRFPIRLEETVNMILEIELPLLRHVDYAYVHRIKQLLQIISQSTPFIPNVSKLAERIGISRATLTTYLKYLEETELLISLYKDSRGISALQKPEKIYLGNTNLMYVLNTENVNKGNLRETFFANQVQYGHVLQYSDASDFLVDGKFTFEIGGKQKSRKQIEGLEYAFVVSDDIEYGSGKRIPLWMFGLLY